MWENEMKVTRNKGIDKVCVGFHDSIKGPLLGYCQQGDDSSGYMEGLESVVYFSDCQLLKKDCSFTPYSLNEHNESVNFSLRILAI
jgi:hypothetical protein